MNSRAFKIFIVGLTLLVLAISYILFNESASVNVPESINSGSTGVSTTSAEVSNSGPEIVSPALPVIATEAPNPVTYSVIGEILRETDRTSGKTSTYVSQLNLRMNTGVRDGSKETVLIDESACSLLSRKVFTLKLVYDSVQGVYVCQSAMQTDSYAISGDVTDNFTDISGRKMSRIKISTASGSLAEDTPGHVLLDTTACDVLRGKYYSFGAIYDSGTKSYVCYVAHEPNDGF